MQRLTPTSNWPVDRRDALRTLERQMQARSKTPLMQLAGRASADLAMAIAPHAQRVWVAAGPGNNGGDGLEAAMHLHRAGYTVIVSLLLDRDKHPTDAQAALARALQAGVKVQTQTPQNWIASMTAQDLCIDAMLGLGSSKPLPADLQSWVELMNRSQAQILALDLPTGLNPESGQLLGTDQAHGVVHADHTLTFIAAKPGLFMGHGRDVCGEIWLSTLDEDIPNTPTTLKRPAQAAWLNSPAQRVHKSHASHKGSHGDVAIIGGEALSLRGMGMSGAAVLAASAALHAGAGRVLLNLQGDASCPVPADLMQRQWGQLDLENLHVVAGCGGGQAMEALMPEILTRSQQLVIDADGLNAVATHAALQQALRQRDADQPTVLTPHPLEAARLLGCSTADIQNDRLEAAHRLAERFACVVVLKGSGSVIAAPGHIPRINATGSGRLATGGTGDVLAGLVGARMAQGLNAFDAACSAVHQHGLMANLWPDHTSLTASQLAQSLN
jgi:hydroxyethylthiazole kinase-like uncharacterized protein yjeF